MKSLFNSRRRIACSVIALLILLGLGSPLLASDYPLADKVPADAVVYFGWAGADALRPAYQASNLQAFIDHSNLPQALGDSMPKLWERLSAEPQGKQVVDAIQKVGPLLWKHPVALYVCNLSIEADGTPNATAAVVCDAGADAADLQSALESSLQTASHVRVMTDGTIVTIKAEKSPGAPSADFLVTAPKFVDTMKSLQPSPALAMYIDAAALLQKGGESAQKDPQAAVIWPKVQEALGLSDVDTFAVTDGFDQGSWQSESILKVSGPRKGLLDVIEPKPIDPALLVRIPASAGSVSVCNFDTVKFFDTLAQAAAVTKQSDTLFHQGTGIASIALGRSLRRQTLSSLGTQWVLYTDSASRGPVMLNHPINADNASDSLVSAVFGITNLANSRLAGARAHPVVTVDQKRIKGIDVTSAITQLFSPTFAVNDKLLYFTLSTDSVVDAATLPPAAEGKDIMHSDHFLAAVKRLGAPRIDSFDYLDIPDTALAAYQSLGASSKQLRQMLNQLGAVDLPELDIPPPGEIKSHLSPALSVSWS